MFLFLVLEISSGLAVCSVDLTCMSVGVLHYVIAAASFIVVGQ
jgi:hypothetical protein